MNWIQNVLSRLTPGVNKYNKNAFFQLGSISVPFDFNNSWAIETALSKNPDVFAIVSQMARKGASVPFYIKKVKDKKELNRFSQNRGYLTKAHLLSKNKAFNSDYLELPLENPNPLYDWKHFIQLYMYYFNTTGNVFIYKHLNEIDEVVGMYVLPSHLMKIYLQDDTHNFSSESPVLGYEMIYNSGALVPFSAEEVIHVKTPNADWGQNGEQLYGVSPLKAAYYNIENQIQANKHLYKMFKSSGAFGFIFAKGEALNESQAKQFSDRIKEMDKSKDEMARISGISKEIGFTRIALSNKDLEPWKSLDFDRKTICNVLGWRDELMNNDGKASLSNSENGEARKAVLLDTIMPQLLMLEASLTDVFSTFKGYENTRFCFDYTDMSEVQEDVAKIVEWAMKAPITTNEVRELLSYEPREEEVANKVLINQGRMTLDELEARGLTFDDVDANTIT